MPLDPASVHIIIPAFNEGRVIASTVAPLLDAEYTVVIVDDCSSDDTWTVLGGIPVVRLRHPLNLGQGASLETGMEYSRRNGALAVVHFDADGQHDPAQIAALIEPIALGEVDVVFGSRFLLESDRLHVPKAKQILLQAGRIISALTSGLWLTDTHNGFRALSRKALLAIRLRENGFAHATEILDEVRKSGLKYIESPTTIRYTAYSTAKGQPMSNALNIVVDVIIRKIFS